MFSRFTLALIFAAILIAGPLVVTQSFASHLTCDGIPTTIDGTAGNDTITGTAGDDVINAQGGNDVINGKGGNDLICAGEGADKVDGGNGFDSIFGEGGNDDLKGSNGNDYLVGGPDSDKLDGGFGVDTGDAVNDDINVRSIEIVIGSVGSPGPPGPQGPAGKNSIIDLSKDPGPINCPAGGVDVKSGVDDNGNGILEAAEVDATSYVCDGQDGSNGSSGTNGLTSLILTSLEPAGPNCADGGVKILIGLDDNGDDILQTPDEVDSTNYVCNGAAGSGSLPPTVQALVNFFVDTDSDGIPNLFDLDIDGDGIINTIDPDVDGDGILNGDDLDVDGDGTINAFDPDVDGDGIPNGIDPDIDGDGIINGHDSTPLGSL